MCRADAEYIALAQPEIAKFCPAKAHRVLEDDPEHRLKLAARRTDGLEDV